MIPHLITHPLGKLCLVAASAVAMVSSASGAQATISSVSGWNATGMVSNGKWTGQPTFSRPPKSNAYLDMIAVESQNSDATFTVTGKNFGTSVGSVQLLDSSTNKISGVSITINSWSNTQVKFTAKSQYWFTFCKGGFIRISRDTNPPPMSYEGAALFPVKGFVGTIKTRGYGQCTWYVAKRRIDAGKTIPTRAYSTTASITASYVPTQWDGLTYAGKHVAIITSKPSKVQKSDGSVVYSFTVSEMNATTDEKETSNPRTFVVKGGTVVTPIGSLAGSAYAADGYWR